MTELQKRVAVSVVFIPIVLGAIYLGGYWLIAVFTLVSLLCTHEYIAMLRQTHHKIGWHWLPVSIAAYMCIVLYPAAMLPVVCALFLIAIVDGVIWWCEKDSIPRLALAFFGALYTAVIPAMIVRFGVDQQDSNLLLLLILLIWITDSTAYFIGTALGKKRGIFKMSPKKSLEGFLTGAIVPVVIVVILYYVGLFDDLALLLLCAFAAGVVGQIGDLAESMLKRYCGVKDSSNLIPGHGGILDRSDSVLLAGSFLYCAVYLLEKVR